MAPSEGPPSERAVVAVVLSCRGRIALLRRSPLLSSEGGRWHCVTGFVESDSPVLDAARELHEETGLGVADLVALSAGPVLSLRDREAATWTVHTFWAETERRRLTLNWEHDDYRWVAPHRLPRFDGQVEWLGQVLASMPQLDEVGRV
ncbi:MULTISPECIES: NUDIX domain-containing protein [unclassified Streptomyces]|uniref:NUDIX domain-containing protein n=1 Tax=unclassified Streptomyces TaxID=2593676 RepID=UPI0036ED9722